MNAHIFRTNSWLLVAAIGLGVLSPLPAYAQTTYHVTDLGTLGGNSSGATALNSYGDVVGSSTTGSGQSHAFLYHNGTMTDLGVLNGSDNSSVAYGINDSGTVVGQSFLGPVGGQSSPFEYSNGQMSFVGSLGGSYGFATSINNAGQIVGISSDSNGVTHGFLRTNGSMANLGSLSQANDYSIAYGVNATGQVAGYSTINGGHEHAFLYNGTMTDLGTLPGVDNRSYS